MTRQEAINVILTLWKFVDRSHDSDIGIDSELIRQAFNLAIKALEEDWILCSERLPEDEQNVLVTYKTTDKIHPCQYHDDGSRNPWYSYIDNCRAHSNVVIAWMPLPEPYKGDTECQKS